jgi:hypothetical protein
MVFKLVVVNQKGFEGHNNNTLVVVAGIQPWQKPGDGEPKRVQVARAHQQHNGGGGSI